MPPASKPAAPAKAKARTLYLVFELVDGRWALLVDVEATSAATAIRQAIPTATDPTSLRGRRYVAVPKSSWQPRELHVETRATITLRELSSEAAKPEAPMPAEVDEPVVTAQEP